MAMTLVQQCKAWFEAGLDDHIINLVISFSKDHKISLNSQDAINLPPGEARQAQIDALFWLAAAQNRQGIKHNDMLLVKEAIDILVPLYSEYCDDLNYYVSLALAFDYLGQYEQALHYLYEAMGQFPKVAHVDDMIELSASKLNLNQCDLSFNLKARNAWQELLDNIPTIKSYLSIVHPSSGELQILKNLVAKPFAKICCYFDVQIKCIAQDVYFYLTCHGNDSLFIALEHCLSLKKDGFPRNWHFCCGLPPLANVSLEIDHINFDSSQTWCSLELSQPLEQLSESRLTKSALNLLNSKFNEHWNIPNKIEPTLLNLNPVQEFTDSAYQTLKNTNLTNNLGQKKTKFTKSQSNDIAHNVDDDLTLASDNNNNDSISIIDDALASEEKGEKTKNNDFDLSQLDPTLFADLFELDDGTTNHFNPEDGTFEPRLNVNSIKAPSKNYVLKVYHPLLYTWFKASKSQHPLQLDRMIKTLGSYALGEVNVMSLFHSVQMVKNKEPFSFKLSKLDQALDAMDIRCSSSYQEYLKSSYFIDYTKDKDFINPTLHATKSDLSADQALLNKLKLPLRKNLIFSVHNNHQLYHEFYHEGCDHSAINLLCSGCVPCFFALERKKLIKSTINSSQSVVKSLQESKEPLFNLAQCDKENNTIFNNLEPNSYDHAQDHTCLDQDMSDEDMIRLTEFFIEGFCDYVISQGYQYSLHFMGYALNEDYIFIDIISFDLKLSLHALSSYLTEYYPHIVSLQAGLMVKGTSSCCIDFIKS